MATPMVIAELHPLKKLLAKPREDFLKLKGSSQTECNRNRRDLTEPVRVPRAAAVGHEAFENIL